MRCLGGELVTGRDWRHLRGSDNGAIWVIATVEEIQSYHEASAYKCRHEHDELRDYQTSNGGWQRKRQCLKCGGSTSQPQSRNKDQAVPLWDNELRARWEAACTEIQSAIETELVDRTNNTEFKGYWLYEDYLKSQEWKKRSKLVMQRDGGTCQACLERRADHVHHHTYDHIFSEFLFELVAVCSECHSGLHSKKIAALEALRATESKARDS